MNKREAGMAETLRESVDGKGRSHIGLMTDREIIEELLTIARRHDDLIMGLVEDLKSGKINPMQAMMGLFRR